MRQRRDPRTSQKRDTVKHTERLSEKQVLMLAALDRPSSAFWHHVRDGRVHSGRRETLYSLSKRGLVEYRGNGWVLTFSGRSWLERHPAERDAAYREIASSR